MMIETYTIEQAKSSMMIQTYTIEQAQEGHHKSSWWYKLTL